MIAVIQVIQGNSDDCDKLIKIIQIIAIIQKIMIIQIIAIIHMIIFTHPAMNGQLTLPWHAPTPYTYLPTYPTLLHCKCQNKK